MHNKAFFAVATAFIFAMGAPAFAAKGGGDHAGGMSSGHVSQSGSTNSNAQFEGDATKGQDRAAERRSVEGTEHANATTHETGMVDAKNKKGKKKPKPDATANN
ncbi:MAG: hypothetical protein ACJ8LN_04015 [Sulfurifustis sp.]